jgi:hypothetical protein
MGTESKNKNAPVSGVHGPPRIYFVEDDRYSEIQNKKQRSFVFSSNVKHFKLSN